MLRIEPTKGQISQIGSIRKRYEKNREILPILARSPWSCWILLDFYWSYSRFSNQKYIWFRQEISVFPLFLLLTSSEAAHLKSPGLEVRL